MILNKCWIVGSVKWLNDDCARVTVAKSKTAARQNAERQLAHAVFIWAKDGDRSKKSWERFSKARYSNFDIYAEAVVSGRYNCSDSYHLRLYLLQRDGIWLTGPADEKIHITRPSKKAMRDRLKCERESEAMMNALIKSISA